MCPSIMDLVLALAAPISVGSAAVYLHFKLDALETQVLRNTNRTDNLKWAVKHLQTKASEQEQVEKGRQEIRQELAKHITPA